MQIQIDDEVSQRRASGRWRPLGRAVFAALLAFLVTGTSAYAQTSGDGIVSGGEECDPPASSCPGYENGLGGCQLFFGGDPAAASCTTGGDCFYAFSCCKFNQQYVGGSNIQCEDGNDCTGLTYCDQVGGCTQVQNLNPAGTACGPPGTICDPADQCDASGVCQPVLAPTTTECRAAGGICDAAEFCDGAGNCPDDVFTPAGTACGDPGTECTIQDTCDGSGGCTDNGFEAVGTSCGDAGTECIVQDTCDGYGTCDDNGFVSAGTACGDPTNSTCNGADTCNGSGACLDNFAATTLVCNPDAGECDVPEFCDGAGNCPADQFEPSGTACGDPTATDCNLADTCDGAGTCDSNLLGAGDPCGDPSNTTCTNPDTCDASGVCQPNNAATTVECRGEANACDVAEFCDGAGSCPADAFEPVGTACGDQSDTTCTDPDTCNGSGTCLENNEPTTVSCRADAGECDVEEFCDGAGNCPAQAFEPAGTACGDSANTTCTDPDTCDGSGTCQANDAATTVECRADGGECDVAEFCDGAGSCPGDGFEPAGTSCGDSSDTACTEPDTCDGSGTCLDNNEPTTVSCRADAGDCDVEEFCDGAGNCPAQAFEPAGTSCGDPTNTTCDAADTCDASGVCLDNFATSGTSCGDPNDTTCDAADTCDGSGQCDDNFATSGTACGDSSNTTCTDPDTCDGSGSCQANDAATTVECRADAGECDVAEFCDGAGSCPADSFESAGTACGSQADTSCTNPDTCDGSGTCLENDEATTVLCRADAGDCDVPEYCDGAGSCPAESFEPAGTACGDGTATDCNLADSCDAAGTCQSNLVAPGVACGDPTSTTCNQADTCDGSGSCDPNYAATTVQCRAAGGACDAGEFCNGAGGCDPDVLTPAGTTCRDSTDVCDPAETCTGASADCPSDGLAPDGTVCSTGDFCEAPGLCTGGVCFPGPQVIVDKVAKLGRAASSTSDITVNASNGRAIFVKNARMEDDTIVAATTVKLALQASIDDVATSNLVNKADKGEVRGAILPAFTTDVPCQPLTFSCGGSDVTVGYLEEYTLPPGSYNRVDVKLDGRLNFEEGEYEICIMKANRNSVLTVLPGATGDQTVLRFEKGLILGENVTLLPGAGVLPPRIEAGKFITSPNCNIQANIFTTDGITKLGRDTFFNGTICAESLKANANVQIGCVPPVP